MESRLKKPIIVLMLVVVLVALVLALTQMAEAALVLRLMLTVVDLKSLI